MREPVAWRVAAGRGNGMIYRDGVAVDPLPLLEVPDGVRIGPPLKGCL